MELLLINENKLKITLSPLDMRDYDLDCDTADYSKTETRRAFWNILDEAKHLTGFDAASDKIYIQLYPSREGGCEMYVTKLVPAPPANLVKLCEKEFFFAFDDLDLLLRVCGELKKSGYSGKSRAYLDGETYYLAIFAKTDDSEKLPERLSFLNEFGTLCDGDIISICADEHFKVVCPNDAVTKLARLA